MKVQVFGVTKFWVKFFLSWGKSKREARSYCTKTPLFGAWAKNGM